MRFCSRRLLRCEVLWCNVALKSPCTNTGMVVSVLCSSEDHLRILASNVSYASRLSVVDIPWCGIQQFTVTRGVCASGILMWKASILPVRGDVGVGVIDNMAACCATSLRIMVATAVVGLGLEPSEQCKNRR